MQNINSRPQLNAECRMQNINSRPSGPDGYIDAFEIHWPHPARFWSPDSPHVSGHNFDTHSKWSGQTTSDCIYHTHDVVRLSEGSFTDFASGFSLVSNRPNRSWTLVPPLQGDRFRARN